MTWNRRTACSLASIWAFLTLGLAAAKGPAADESRWQRIDLQLAGKAVALAPDTLPGDEDALLILIAPLPEATAPSDDVPPPIDGPPDPCASRATDDDATISLWRSVFPRDGGIATPTLIRDDLPGADGRIVVDDSGELLVVLPGRLVRVPRDGSAFATLLSDPGLHPRSSTALSTPTGWLVSIPGMGNVRFLRLRRDGTLERSVEVDVPVKASLGTNAFRLESELPRRFPDEVLGAPVWTSPPVAEGRQRLRGVRIEPDATPAQTAWWGRLPDEEEVFGFAELSVAGEPAVLVTSRRADKLGLFGEKRLRLFRLRADRGQTGHPPFFAVETRVNLWQPISPKMLDVNGDGEPDLVLGYWKGLVGSRVVLDVYLGDGRGSFASSPRTTALDVKRADRSFLSYGYDFDGDSRPDLAVIGDGALQLFRGTPPNSKGTNLVSTRPDGRVSITAEDQPQAEIEVSLGSGGIALEGEAFDSRPVWILDLGADGRYEALFPHLDGGRAMLSLIRFEK